LGLSREAKKSIKKAQKVQRRKRRKTHWLIIQKGDDTKEIIYKVITQLCCIVVIASVIILWDYFKAMYDNSKLNSSLQNIYGNIYSAVTGDGQLLPSAEALLEINPDTVGWVKIEGTKVDNPVVLRKDDTPDSFYYLTHNFNGESAKAGTVFVDYRSTIGYKKQSDNLVIYGHNEKDNSMFGDLDRYKKDIEYYREHPVIQFNTNYETGEYKIIACFVTNVLPSQSADGTVFDYQNYIDFDEARYNDFINNVMLRSQIITTVDCRYGDRFITLSTCSNEFEPSRFVVVARKVREDEDATVDVAGAYVNENAKEPDWDVIYGR